MAILGVRACSGVALIVLSVLGSAFYNASGEKVFEGHSPLQVTLYSYYVLLLVMLPVTVSMEASGFFNLTHYSTTVWTGLAILAIFQYFLSMIIFLNVLTRIQIN